MKKTMKHFVVFSIVVILGLLVIACTNTKGTFTLSLIGEPSSGGVVTGSGKYAPGVMINIMAATTEGYRFLNWSQDGVVFSTMPTTVYEMPTENATLVATFEEDNTPDPIPEMIFVQGGNFRMGNTRDDGEGESDEKPVHEVALTYDYAIGKYEVTFNEYDAYCETVEKAQPNDEGWGRGIRPVIHVSWYEAIAFCNWVSEQAGLQPAYDAGGNLLDVNGQQTTDITQVIGYRLPTEAEWEYAARGGHVDIIGGVEVNDFPYAGSDYSNEVAWYSTWISDENTQKVGQKKPNELGLYDMSGNVWEWCYEWYGEYPDTKQTNPIGTTDSCNRVLRSGSWGNPASRSRVAERYMGKPSSGHKIIGFRLARSLD